MVVATLHRRNERLGDTVRKLVRRGARANLSRLLAKVRPEDVALLFDSLTPTEQLVVFDIVVRDYPDSAGEVLTKMESSERLGILRRLSPEKIAGILEPMPVDDAVFVVESLPEDLKEEVLERVDLRDLSDVQVQLTYRDDSAGRIMSTEFFSLPEAGTAGQAIQAIQQAGEDQIEMIFYLYIVDEEGQLVGVTSMRQLLLTPPSRPLGQIMTRSVIQVTTDTDQEEVARLAARYDLLAIPVTDEEGRLVGIVTVDDIIDVVNEEATEDFLRMVGTTEDELVYQEHSWKVASIRLPWILFNLLGLVACGLLVRRFEISLQETVFLIIFVPVIMGMGGNIGSQTMTIAVRGLATGRLAPGQGRARHFVGQQLRVGTLLAGVCAVIIALGSLGLAWWLDSNPYYSLIVAGSLFLAITAASLSGAAIPVLFQRLGFDPAVASGPLVTTSSDILGILIYLGMSVLMIQWFLH